MSILRFVLFYFLYFFFSNSSVIYLHNTDFLCFFLFNSFSYFLTYNVSRFIVYQKNIFFSILISLKIVCFPFLLFCFFCLIFFFFTTFAVKTRPLPTTSLNKLNVCSRYFNYKIVLNIPSHSNLYSLCMSITQDHTHFERVPIACSLCSPYCNRLMKSFITLKNSKRSFHSFSKRLQFYLL